MNCPLSYEIDATRGIVHLQYSAPPTFDEWSKTMDQIFADTALLPPFGILIDQCSVLHHADAKYIKCMVQYVDRQQATFGFHPWAIVAADVRSFGMGRMAEQLVQKEGCVRTFKNVSEAEAWLAEYQGERCEDVAEADSV
jgi:hypothetical protein